MQIRDRKTIKKELENNDVLKACAQEFGIVGDTTRLKVCYLLCRHKELSVSEIADLVGVSISAVSHTLKKLQRAEIVERRRESRTVYYQLTRTPFTKFIKERLTK